MTCFPVNDPWRASSRAVKIPHMEPFFPGMDPYLEAPGIWPGFHEAFLFCVREVLQPVPPERYYAELRTREEVGIAGFPSDAVLYSDVAVKDLPQGWQAPGAARSGTTAVAAPEHLVIASQEPLTVSFVEVRETAAGGRLVTLIDLLSPSNKLSCPDRESFERKQEEILSSDAHWIEIDLLRSGKRVGGHARVDTHCRAKGYDYVIVVSRSSKRSPLDLEIYGFKVRDLFPVVGVPLCSPDPDVALDLGKVFRRAYETGPYRKLIRYDLAPDPPLSGEQAAWARGVLEARGVRPRA